MYKSLFIDLDDTIWAFSQNAKNTFHEVYQQYNFDRYFDSFDHFFSIYQKHNQYLWEEYAKGNISKEELNNQRFIYPLQSVGVDDKSLAKAYSDDFFAIIPTKSTLMPHAKEALDYLVTKYHLYILSNGFRELQSRKMKSAGIEQYFKKVILSEDILKFKPYPEIFHFALSATQTQLNDALMIGDSWKADIIGAKGVNMDQMYYTNGKKEVNEFTPTYLLESWQKIRNFL